MPVLNTLADAKEEVAGWRRHLHAHPELMYEVHATAAYVAQKLRAFGCDTVVEGLGRTGVAALIRGHHGQGGEPADDGPVRTIALRADMDALPILETTGKEHASTVPGVMHACGHDGHTAMLLAAARHLAETRSFAGNVVVVFQPAEEGGAGAKAMIDDGLLERFGIGEVYGMHNYPGLPVGHFALRSGPIMASADRITITVTGVGGHAARPHLCADPVVAAAHIILAVQTVVSRNVDPLESAVVSLTMVHGGETDNVIPQSVSIGGTVRTLKPQMRDLVEERLAHVVATTAAALGVTAQFDYSRDYPVVVNDAGRARLAAQVAAEIVGPGRVDAEMVPVMGGEDFAFMLEARPGCFIFTGNGEDSANLHNPDYDFNDEAIPVGASYWVRLAETALAR
ncbi:MAG: amidohydrolase [Hyphomicrobiaceae bacterium]|nr:amidohydrolase [Hyphomicrobiaceae bacterium]